MKQRPALLCLAALTLSSCASDVNDLVDIFQSNMSQGAKAAGHKTVVKLTLYSFPIGPQEIGNGRQFDHDPFDATQWDLREITPGL